jgi:hypothetical protein
MAAITGGCRKYRDPSGENVAEDHDRYLDEAYGDWQERPR